MAKYQVFSRKSGKHVSKKVSKTLAEKIAHELIAMVGNHFDVRQVAK